MTSAIIQWVSLAIGIALIAFLCYRAWKIYTPRKKEDDDDEQ